jgi:hypothetical protein
LIAPRCFVTLISNSRDFLSGAFEAELFDGGAQPARRRAVVDFLARLYKKRGRLGTRGQLVGFAQRGEFLVVLESPVHIYATRFTVLDIVFVLGSALWTNSHGHTLLIVQTYNVKCLSHLSILHNSII